MPQNYVAMVISMVTNHIMPQHYVAMVISMVTNSTILSKVMCQRASHVRLALVARVRQQPPLIPRTIVLSGTIVLRVRVMGRTFLVPRVGTGCLDPC